MAYLIHSVFIQRRTVSYRVVQTFSSLLSCSVISITLYVTASLSMHDLERKVLEEKLYNTWCIVGFDTYSSFIDVDEVGL